MYTRQKYVKICLSGACLMKPQFGDTSHYLEGQPPNTELSANKNINIID